MASAREFPLPLRFCPEWQAKKRRLLSDCSRPPNLREAVDTFLSFSSQTLLTTPSSSSLKDRCGRLRAKISPPAEREEMAIRHSPLACRFGSVASFLFLASKNLSSVEVILSAIPFPAAPPRVPPPPSLRLFFFPRLASFLSLLFRSPPFPCSFFIQCSHCPRNRIAMRCHLLVSFICPFFISWSSFSVVLLPPLSPTLTFRSPRRTSPSRKGTILSSCCFIPSFFFSLIRFFFYRSLFPLSFPLSYLEHRGSFLAV